MDFLISEIERPQPLPGGTQMGSREFHKQLSLRMGKPTICIENKDTDQLRSNCEADQRLCFRYILMIPLLSKSKFSSP